ncbi:hypothetical protein KDH83_02295, partial [Achromobacter sp. Marseille-Q0513]|uniref:hypothetical protein n=1 Tax=Achromobacter sp. Marseille-Q0513 TaxID=2829161 RepID=UPI001B9DFF8F
IESTLAADFACALAEHLSKLRAPVADERAAFAAIAKRRAAEVAAMNIADGHGRFLNAQGHQQAISALDFCVAQFSALPGSLAGGNWRDEFSRRVYEDLAAADNQDVPLEEYPARILGVLDALASAPVADESPMAKMADALREKARQEQQAYQDRRNQATEWGPMPEGTEADNPTSSAPVAGEYTSAMGEAAEAYLNSFPYAHKLPAQFRWADLWAAMSGAAPQASEAVRPNIPPEKPLPDLMMATYHEAVGWNACRAAMLRSMPLASAPVADDWTPTPANINALPERVRAYIHDLVANADPSGMVAENTLLRDQTKQLDAMIGRLKRELASAPVAGEAVAWEIPNPHLGSELTSHKARADEARRLGLTVHELFRHAAPQASAMPALNDAMRAVINNERDVYETPDALYAALCDAAGAPSSSPRRRRSRDMADLQQLAFDLSERDWTWWDSCSFRRLTFDDGPDTADGSALYGTVHSSDGHPDVQMAPGVREFIEAASPKNVAHIFRELEAEKRKVAVLRHAILKHLNDTDKKEK